MNSKDFVHSFNQAFKRLEARLRHISGSDDSVRFYDVLTKVEKVNYLVKAKRWLILDLYALRNIFSHADREEYIARVESSAYDQINQIIDLLDNPPSAGVVFETSVYVANAASSIEVVVKQMASKLYTHVPIYNNDNYIGVFSESTLLEWLAENISGGRAEFNQKQVIDVPRRYLNPKTNIIKFISSSKSVFEIPSLFEKAIENHSRLGAILITTDGLKNQRPMGIITAWDLPRLEKYIK